MVLAWQDDIEGWTITGRCEEYKPDGWRPGDRVKYAVEAKAELRFAFRDRFKEDAPQLLRFPAPGGSAVFDTSGEGKEAAIRELSSRIEVLKK